MWPKLLPSKREEKKQLDILSLLPITLQPHIYTGYRLKYLRILIFLANEWHQSNDKI